MMRGWRVYTATFNAVAVTAATDLFELNAASGKPCVLMRVEFAQYTDFGDAQDEILPLLFKQDFSTSGSGGSAPTATPAGGDTAFSGTVETNNTTVASGGSPLTVYATGWNVRAGYIWAPDPDCYLHVKSSGRLIINQAAPADSITMNGVIVFAEFGG